MLWGDCNSYCCRHAVFPRRIQTSLSIASSVRFKVIFEQQGLLNKNKAFLPPSIITAHMHAVQNKCDGLLGGSAEGSRQVKWADLDPRWRLIGWLDNWVLSERLRLAWQVFFFNSVTLCYNLAARVRRAPILSLIYNSIRTGLHNCLHKNQLKLWVRL